MRAVVHIITVALFFTVAFVLAVGVSDLSEHLFGEDRER